MAENPTPQDDFQPSMVYVTEPVQWEYKRRMTLHPPSEDDLNQLGSIGWELCSIVLEGHEYVAYFKRMK